MLSQKVLYNPVVFFYIRYIPSRPDNSIFPPQTADKYPLQFLPESQFSFQGFRRACCNPGLPSHVR